MIHALLLLLSVASAAPPSVAHDDLAALGRHVEITRDTLRAGGWSASTRPAREASAEGLRLLGGDLHRCETPVLDRAADRLREAGQALTVHTVDDARFLMVHDGRPGRGGPLLLLRCGPADEIAVQAPHGWYDLHTDDIALDAFLGTGLRAVMLNTVHRYEAAPGEQPTDPIHPADVTDHPASLFQTATLALTVARPTLRIVQLHGFASDTADALVILSVGTSSSPPARAAAPTAEALELPARVVRVYGLDTDVLGGTRNAQARALLQAPSPRFLHVELARPVRDALKADASASARLLAALGSVPWSR